MISGQTTIIRNTADPALQALSNAVAPAKRRPLALVLGRKAEGVYRAWFRQREKDSPNKRGWPRQHFWSRMAKRTALLDARTTADQAVVVVADPAINAHVHGATIRPKEAKALALPLRAEAYGIRPRAGFIPGLFVLRRKATGKAWLAARVGNALRLFWRLAHSVRVPKDPRALPPAKQVLDQLVQTGLAFVRRATGQGGGR